MPAFFTPSHPPLPQFDGSAEVADQPLAVRVVPATRTRARNVRSLVTRVAAALTGVRALAAVPVLARLVRFGLVGASGILVNLVVLAGALRLAEHPSSVAVQATAETLATQVAILWNFALTERWVFRTDGPHARRLLRFAGYWLVSVVSLAVQLPLAAALTRVVPFGYVPATALALLLLVVARYAVCHTVLYRRGPRLLRDGLAAPCAEVGEPA
jgi:putative flippase GtrA